MLPCSSIQVNSPPTHLQQNTLGAHLDKGKLTECNVNRKWLSIIMYSPVTLLLQNLPLSDFRGWDVRWILRLCLHPEKLHGDEVSAFLWFNGALGCKVHWRDYETVSKKRQRENTMTARKKSVSCTCRFTVWASLAIVCVFCARWLVRWVSRASWILRSNRWPRVGAAEGMWRSASQTTDPTSVMHGNWRHVNVMNSLNLEKPKWHWFMFIFVRSLPSWRGSLGSLIASYPDSWRQPGGTLPVLSPPPPVAGCHTTIPHHCFVPAEVQVWNEHRLIICLLFSIIALVLYATV